MNDLISRKQAIDVIDKEQKEIDVSDVSAMYAYSKCKTIIKQLPSALGTNLAEVGTEYISRQDAIDAAIEAADDWDGGCNIGRQKRIENYIKRLPPAQSERIKSKWALHTYMPHNKFCLTCRNDSPYNKRWDFCPNCGADMREVTT